MQIESTSGDQARTLSALTDNEKTLLIAALNSYKTILGVNLLKASAKALGKETETLTSDLAVMDNLLAKFMA